MPRIDPITGCSVMTTGEFWNAEAQQEGQGRSGGDLVADFYAELEADTQRREQEFRDNPEALLTMVNEAAKLWVDGVDPEDLDGVCFPGNFKRVVEVLDVTIQDGMRNSSTSVTAKYEMGDGSLRMIMYSEWSSGGSFFEPPDFESEFKILS
jgi:hypothetical protein